VPASFSHAQVKAPTYYFKKFIEGQLEPDTSELLQTVVQIPRRDCQSEARTNRNFSVLLCTIQVQDMKLFGKLFPTPLKLIHIFPDLQE